MMIDMGRAGIRVRPIRAPARRDLGPGEVRASQGKPAEALTFITIYS